MRKNEWGLSMKPVGDLRGNSLGRVHSRGERDVYGPAAHQLPLACSTRFVTRLTSEVASPSCAPVRPNTRTLGTDSMPNWRVTGVFQFTISILSKTTSGSVLANCSSCGLIRRQGPHHSA